MGLFAALVSALGATFQMIVALSLPPRLVGGATLHQLTSGMFTISYGIAFALPLAGGLVADALGYSLLTLAPILLLALAVVPLRISTIEPQTTVPPEADEVNASGG